MSLDQAALAGETGPVSIPVATSVREAQLAATLNLDLRKATFAAASDVGQFIILLVIKTLRIKTAAQSDFISVSTLTPFRIQQSDVPEPVATAMQRTLRELGELGFHESMWHRVEASPSGADSTLQVSREHADMLADIAQLQSKTTHWGTTLTILVLSLIAFMAAGMGGAKWDVSFLAVVVGVLFVHELGHYVAMRLSGYRNLKMFFIPLLGAAVSGQSFNVAGWKKTIVSLMGPVPGILLAIPIGIVGVIMGWQAVTLIAIAMLVLNALNLLPILPLDGGWVMHHVLFCRNAWVDVIFRIIAVGLLLLASVGLGDKVLMWVAIAVAIQLPVGFKVAQIVQQLRRQQYEAISHDDQTIPPGVAIPIIERVKTAFPKSPVRMNAQRVLMVFDQLSARPPGLMASTGLLFAHGLSFIMALLFMVVFALGMHGGVEGLANAGRMIQTLSQLRNIGEYGGEISTTSIRQFGAPPDGRVAPLSIAVTCESAKDAEALASRVAAMVPADGSCMLFGQSVVVGLPEDDDDVREKLFAVMAEDEREPFVHRPGNSWHLSIMFDLPGGDTPEMQRLVDWSSVPNIAKARSPWDPAADESELRQMEELGVVCREVSNAGVLPDETWEAISKKYDDEVRRGVRDAAKKMQEEQQRAVDQRIAERVAELIAKYPKYEALLSAYRDAPASSEGEGRWQILPKIAEPHGVWVDESSNLYGVTMSAASLEAPRAFTVWPISLQHSGPAVLRFLEQRGATNLRYTLGGYAGDDTFFED